MEKLFFPDKFWILSIHGIPILVPDCQRDLLYVLVKAGASTPDPKRKRPVVRLIFWNFASEKRKSTIFFPAIIIPYRLYDHHIIIII